MAQAPLGDATDRVVVRPDCDDSGQRVIRPEHASLVLGRIKVIGVLVGVFYVLMVAYKAD